MTPDSLWAYLSPIHKDGKDHSQCGNYRPTALLNVDLKLFSKILANRLLPYIPQLIHVDQVGFVPSREARDNTTRVLNIIQAAHSSKRPLLLLPTDVEKAFDRVAWHLMQATLSHIGIGSHFTSWILSLYSTPSASVRVNELHSEYFSISNGTRQGCPFSPVFYINAEAFSPYCSDRPKYFWSPEACGSS